MNKIYLGTFLLFLFSCGQNQQESVAEFGQGHQATWITDERELPANDSLFYLEHPAPLFRKEFKTTNKIVSAKLYITAAGYYRASINDKTVGKNVLDPAWTDFGKRIYYSDYDVTSLLENGDNCIGVSLGNGFYNPLPLRKWGRRNLRNDLSTVGKPVFITKLVVNYLNGKSEEITSDNTWKYNYGPLVKNSVYIGVVYDARKEIAGWDLAGFDDNNWNFAKTGQAPGGKLQKTFFPPVQITKEITPIEIYTPDEGKFIVDMGVNFTGTFKMKLSGNKGDTVTFRFGERIYEDGNLNPMTAVIGQIKRKGVGGPGAPDIAWQTDSYILGDSSAWFNPEFTYHTYRYMEITGLNYKPEISDVKGLFMHSNLKRSGNFSSSEELLNKIQEATERTFLANLVSVQSDCPAREKFGYGGDLNATSESFIYNFDMQSFYRKTIYDWVDAMNDSSFVDTAPYVGIQYCGISWESAFLITQYYLYLYYNDTEIIEEFYELNNQWMEKVARIHPDGLVDKGLSDHESLEPVPVELTGTCHYLQCARIMKTFASVMNDAENEKKYDELTLKLQNLLRSEFWDKPVKEKMNRQTLFSTLLYHGIVPEDEIEAAKDSLMNGVKNGPSGHFNTGIFGTKYVLETLSEYVSPDSVFDIVNSTNYPGWGYMIDRGATTIWETWKESDNTYSNCHPMFGTVTEWYYRWLAGIRPVPEFPGFKEFIIAPSIPKGLESVSCNYHCPFGEIVSNWKKDQKGRFFFEMKIPPETTANVILPVNQFSEVKISSKIDNFRPEKIKGLQSGNFKLNEGAYLITLSAIN